MANESEFSEQEAYAQPLVMRLLAMGLIVMGAVIIAMGMWADNVFVVAGGMTGVMWGGTWRLWLAIPDP